MNYWSTKWLLPQYAVKLCKWIARTTLLSQAYCTPEKLLRSWLINSFGVNHLCVYSGVCVWLVLKMIAQYLLYLLMAHLIWWHIDSVLRFNSCSLLLCFLCSVPMIVPLLLVEATEKCIKLLVTHSGEATDLGRSSSWKAFKKPGWDVCQSQKPV